MKRTLLLAILFSALSVLPCRLPPAAFAGKAGADEILTDAGSIKTFADTMYHRGFLFRAAMEYERFLYLHPSHPDAPNVLFNLAAVAKRAGDWQAAVKHYTGFLSRYPRHELAGEAGKALGEMEGTILHDKTEQPLRGAIATTQSHKAAMPLSPALFKN